MTDHIDYGYDQLHILTGAMEDQNFAKGADGQDAREIYDEFNELADGFERALERGITPNRVEETLERLHRIKEKHAWLCD